jgi:hypothetical protein
MLFKLVQRIREEFEEAPGLRFTLGEAARFWGMDEETCACVLAKLLATGFLAVDFDGRYAQSRDGLSRRSTPSPAYRPIECRGREGRQGMFSLGPLRPLRS